MDVRASVSCDGFFFQPGVDHMRGALLQARKAGLPSEHLPSENTTSRHHPHTHTANEHLLPNLQQPETRLLEQSDPLSLFAFQLVESLQPTVRNKNLCLQARESQVEPSRWGLVIRGGVSKDRRFNRTVLNK